MLFLHTILTQFLAFVYAQNEQECKLDCLGLNYRGHLSRTRTHAECQRWDSQEPWQQEYFTLNNQFVYDLSENYCRNPDEDPGGPWCIVNSLDEFWDYCDIPVCVNECKNGQHNCHHNATCTDTDLAFECTCNYGTVGNGISCTAQFLPTLCCFIVAIVVIGLCEANLCGESGNCSLTSSEPGYLCICSSGFTGNGSFCQNINECESSLQLCQLNSTCVDSIGSYFCQCNEGYVKDNLSSNCIDENECTNGKAKCNASANCINLNGSYRCQCPNGTFGDGIHGCFGIDICALISCKYGSCIPVSTGFKCNCNEGYEGILCDADKDECNQDSICNAGRCRNSPGSFSCVCESGWTGRYCNVTVDACVSNPCDANALCTNSGNNFSCACNSQFCGNGFQCYRSYLLTLPAQKRFVFSDVDQAFSIGVNSPIQLGNEKFSVIYVHRNGYLFFSNSVTQLYLSGSVVNPSFRLICPYCAQFANGSALWERFQNANGLRSSENEVLDGSLKLIKKTDPSLVPTTVIVAEWTNYVGDFNKPTISVRTFQILLASDGVTTVAFFIYDPCGFRHLTEYELSSNDNIFIGYISSQGIVRSEIQLRNITTGTNIGLPSAYRYVVSTGGSSSDAIQKCLSWFNQEPLLETWRTSFTACPWSLTTASRDRRWGRSPGNGGKLRRSGLDRFVFRVLGNGQRAYCFQLRNAFRLFPSYSGPRCCYDVSNRFLPLASWYQRTQISMRLISNQLLLFMYNQYIETEYNAERDCSEAGTIYWELFLSKRPLLNTTNYRPPPSRRGWADPHFTTVLGKYFTFNGLGEFYLVFAPDEFLLQGRMMRVRNSNGSLTEATVVTALVAFNVKNNTKVVFEPSPLNGSLLNVTINGVVAPLPEEAETEEFVSGISYQITNEGYYQVFLSTDIAITVFSRDGILSYSLSMSDDITSQVRGLMGPFIERNGSVLSESELLITNRSDILNGTFDQEKMWFYGNTWRVYDNETLFSYPPGTNWTTFNPRGHRPPFLTDLVDSLPRDELDSILLLCSNQLSCVYDFAVTRNMEIASLSKDISIISEQEQALVDNTPPVISYTAANPQLRFIASQTTEQRFTAKDDNNDTVVFSVSTLPGISINAESGLLSSSINSTLVNLLLNNTDLHLIVYASDGLVTMQVVVPVLVCDCSGHGTCLWQNTPYAGSFGFGVVSCMCDNGFFGAFCQSQFRACLSNPCFTTCVNAPNTTQGFLCDPCPAGLEGNGINCGDVNECLNATSCGSFSKCNNTLGSYTCECFSGYLRPPGSGLVDACLKVKPCDVDEQLQCQVGEKCTKTGTSITCDCPLSRSSDGRCYARLFKTVISGIYNATTYAEAILGILNITASNPEIAVTEVTDVPESPGYLSITFAVNAGKSLIDEYLVLRNSLTTGKNGSVIFIDIPTPVHRPVQNICKSDEIPFGSIPVESIVNKTECKDQLITIKIETCLVVKLISKPSLILGFSGSNQIDPECLPVTIDTIDGGLITVFLIENFYKCGSKIEEVGGAINFIFRVHSFSGPIDSGILRSSEYLSLSVKCVYKNVLEISSNWHGTKHQIQEFGFDSASFAFASAVFVDQDFKERLDGSVKAEVVAGQFVYYKFSLLIQNKDLIAQAISCWATPTVHPQDAVNFYFIENGCTKDNISGESFVQNLMNSETSNIEFGLRTFVWSNLAANQRMMYVHCHIKVCANTDRSRCLKPDCSRRRKRSRNLNNFQLVTSTGVRILPPCDKLDICDHKCEYESNKVICSCNEGYMLGEDFRSCIAIEGPFHDDYSAVRNQNDVSSESHLFKNHLYIALFVFSILLFVYAYMLSVRYR